MLISISLTACKKELKTPEEKLGYVLGADVGKSYKTFKENEVNFDEEAFFKGFTDGMNDSELLLTADEIKAVQVEAITKLKKNLELKKASEAEKNLKEGAQFLVENSEKEGVVVTKSGLQYQVLTKGDGPVPVATDTVKVHYVGKLLDGTEFDSSYTRGKPAEFRVGGVIKGWSEALQMMPTGSKWKLFIPSELAYGARGAGQKIGPNATLVFEVELLEIVK
nr:FKBP-type peptidyl-prolyl cis-trans isomerase [Syntrophotalea carbinolica]